jgi:hypothetical protein
MARYRVTDGAWRSGGADGLIYFYAPNEVRPDDRPAAIEFGLPERDQAQ